MKDALSKCSLSGLVPDGSNLFLYLGDFFEVSAPFVVGNLGFEFIDFLLVLPNGTREGGEESKGRGTLATDKEYRRRDRHAASTAET